MVEEDGSILRWCDQGVGDDVGVGRCAGDGDDDDSDRTRVLADGCERGQRSAKPGVCAAADHTALMALTSYEANDTVANSRKNPLEAWRRLQKRHDPTTGGRKRNLLRMITSPGRCSLLELLARIERWESHVSRFEKKMHDKLDDEIKLAGLESLERRRGS